MVRRSRKVGAAGALALLVVGLVARVREGKTEAVGKSLVCMGLCGVVWIL